MFFITKVGHSVGQQRCEVFVLKGIKLLVISVKEGLMTCFKGWVWVGMLGFYMGLASISSKVIYYVASTAKNISSKGILQCC